MMEVGSAILMALVAGATAALKDTAGQAVKDAYQGLKGLLAGRLSSLATLEEDPSDEDYQKTAAKELGKKGLAQDEAIVAKARELLELAAKAPPDQLAASGVDIQRVKAAADILIRDIEGRGGITVKDIQAGTGKIDISGIRA
jgi:hypothetical protein